MMAEHSERVVRVLPDVSALRKTFDYSVPAVLGELVRVGSLVRIVLGGRRVGGWVVEDHVVPAPGVVLRPVSSVRGWGPPPRVLEVAQWAAWRWAGAVPTLLRTASSSVAVRTLPPVGSSLGPRPDLGSVSSTVAGLGAGTTVVRLGPASDPWPIVLAAVARREGARDDAGALVLAPTHRGAGDVARRLKAAGIATALLPADWAQARAGGCVAVGARAAAFAPLPRLVAAVVLDAHDEAYHEERAPDVGCMGGSGRACPSRRRAVRAGVAVPHAREPGRGITRQPPAQRRAAGLARGRGHRSSERRPPHRDVLRAPGAPRTPDDRVASRAGGMCGQPDRSCPIAVLCSVWRAGAL